MDYTIKPCSLCAYVLPVTWTSKTEMIEVLRAMGWFITDNYVYCPSCWRVQKCRYLKKNTTA